MTEELIVMGLLAIIAAVVFFFFYRRERFVNVVLKDPDFRHPQVKRKTRKEIENAMRMDKNLF